MADRKVSFEAGEARALWRRAAELQAAAERDHEPGRGTSLVPVSDADLSLEEVTEAAHGAGISREYVVVAAAERRLPDAEAIRRDRRAARWVRRIVDEPDSIEVSGLIQAPPERVLTAFRTVVGTPAFQMVPEDSVGADATRDGVLVYRSFSSGMSSTFHRELDLADVRVLMVTVRPAGEAARLRLFAPLFRRELNLAISGGFTGVAGAGGSAGGAAAGGAVAGWLGVGSTALIAGPAVAGALLGGALGLAGYRRLYRWSWRKGDAALHRLLRAVTLEAGSSSEP